MEIYTNIVNNSNDKKINKLKLIEDERNRLSYIKDLKNERYNHSIKPEVNELYKKTIELNKSKRKIYIKFKDTKNKYINDYIENEINLNTIEYKILKRKTNSIIIKIKEITKKRS